VVAAGTAATGLSLPPPHAASPAASKTVNTLFEKIECISFRVSRSKFQLRIVVMHYFKTVTNPYPTTSV
jgi:hypothetical protein